MFRTTLLTTTCALLISGAAYAQTAAPTPAPAEPPAAAEEMPVSSKDMFGNPTSGETDKVGFLEPKEGQLSSPLSSDRTSMKVMLLTPRLSAS